MIEKLTIEQLTDMSEDAIKQKDFRLAFEYNARIMIMIHKAKLEKKIS